MSPLLALSLSDVLESVFEVFFLLQWQLPVLPVVCIVLGVLTARKSHRSVFNWVLVGLLAGIIPVVGPILMVVAYFWYPPPPPTNRPGHHPPKTSAKERTRTGESRPRERR
jgi:hypothetical protein